MKNNLYKFILSILFIFIYCDLFAQYTLKVRFNTFGQTAGNRDCDGFGAGDSDF